MRVAGSRDPDLFRRGGVNGSRLRSVASSRKSPSGSAVIAAEAAHAPVGARQAGSQQTKGALLFKLGRGHPPPQIVMPQQAAGQRLPLLDKIGADLRQPLFYRRQQAGDMNMQLVLRAAIFRVDRQ